MATTEFGKYFDERGHNVLLNEDALRELGLLVEKTRVGEWAPTVGSGGVFGLFDLKFKKKDETFSESLVEFLKNRIGVSPQDIATLQEQAVHSPEEF